MGAVPAVLMGYLSYSSEPYIKNTAKSHKVQTMYLRKTKEAEGTEMSLRDIDSNSHAPFKHGVGFIES